MAKKKTVQKIEKKGTVKKQVSKIDPVKKRKANRYNTFRTYASKYCAKNYGQPCSNDKMNRVYRQIKAEYYDNGKFLSEAELNQIIAISMNQFDKGLPPPQIQTFPWYEMQDILLQYKDVYFKPDDILVFDLSDLGFLDLFVNPFDEVINTVAFEIRARLDTLRKGDKDIESPVPMWDMIELDIKSKPRKFKYKLSVGTAASNEYAVLPYISNDPFTPTPETPPETPPKTSPETPEPTPKKTKKTKKKKRSGAKSSAILDETSRIKAETVLVQEQSKLASLQLQKANKALELIGKGFSIDQVNKLLGI